MELAEVPCPQVGKGQVLIRTKASLISAGTEKMLVEFSKANIISKARQQPDMGVDVNPRRLELAKTFGAETVNVAAGGDPVVAANAWSGGKGVDAVLITASAKKDQIVHQAAQSCRKLKRPTVLGSALNKEDKVCADCDMFVKALTLPGIALPDIVNIQTSMSYILFQKLATRTFLPSF